MTISKHSEICTHFPESGSPPRHHTQGKFVPEVAAMHDEQSWPKYEQLKSSAVWCTCNYVLIIILREYYYYALTVEDCLINGGFSSGLCFHCILIIV